MRNGWFFVLCVTLIFGILFGLFQIMVFDLPRLHSVEDYRPPLTSRVFDSEGNLVAEFYKERRTLIPIDQIPDHVKNAFLAAEDAKFYEHSGLDYIGILRAALNEVKYRIVGGKRMGGSTITQQTAKTMLLSRRRTYTRKIKEFILAKRIEDRLEKDEILNLYLNQIYFGNGAYGIEEAAKTYYNRSARDLTLGQAAVLAGIPKSPNRINPIKNPKRSLSRRNYILDLMVLHDFVSQAAVEIARRESVEGSSVEKPYLGRAPYYTEEIRRMLIEQFGEETVYHDGLQVYTPLNLTLQDLSQKALRRGIRRLDKRQGYRGPIVRLDQEKQNEFALELQAIKEEKKTTGTMVWDLSALNSQSIDTNPKQAIKSVEWKPLEIDRFVAGLVTEVNDIEKKSSIDLGSLQANLPFSKMVWARPFNTDDYTPRPKLPSDVIKKGDVVLVRISTIMGPNVEVSLEQKPLVEGAVVIIEPFSHRVIAMVGGFDFHVSSFNRATQARRQPGSSFKPFIYAKAIDEGIVTASTLITDAPKVYINDDNESQWKPRNSSGRFLGDITVHSCLMSSINTCSITLLEKVGIKSVHNLAASTGILTENTPLAKDLTLALGSGEVIPLSLFNAYTIFPNGGQYAPPVMLEQVVSSNGRILYEAPPIEPQQVLKPETTYIISNIMQGLMKGTGKRITKIDDTVAGKTGTTNDFRSAWFVGFSQDLVAGVYVGFDNNFSLGKGEYGARAALPIWGYLMKDVLELYPTREFIQPDGIVWRLIDPKTGLLAGPDAVYDPNASRSAYRQVADESEVGLMPLFTPPKAVLDAFIEGTEPTQTVGDTPPPPLELYDIGGLKP